MSRRVVAIITRVFALLLLGAIVNVAVAWGCAALVVPKVRLPCAARIQIVAGEPPTVVWMSVDRASSFGVWRHRLAENGGWSSVANQAPPTAENWIGGPNPTEMFSIALPTWTRLGVRIDGNRSVSTEIEAANGWPMPTMYCILLERQNKRGPASPWQDVFDSDSAIVLKRSTSADNLVGLRALPLIPIWPGIAINTVFYAVVIWALFAVPAALGRKRRRARGQCPACAYPIGTSDVCTECGASVRPGAKATP